MRIADYYPGLAEDAISSCTCIGSKRHKFLSDITRRVRSGSTCAISKIYHGDIQPPRV